MPPDDGVGVVVLPELEPEPMPEDPGAVGLVVLPLEPEPIEPLGELDAPLPALPLRASRWHLSRSAPVRPTHLLASVPDAPEAAPLEPDVDVSLLPEDELPDAEGVLLDELPEDDGEVVDELLPDAEGVLVDESAEPVLPEDD